MKSFSSTQKLLYTSLNQCESVKDFSHCTHLGVGAHPDDLEIMAGHGIEQCLKQPESHFLGVICTTGGGSARSGEFSQTTDQEMVYLREQEQISSAKMGRYLGVIGLNFDSSQIKKDWNIEFLNDLQEIILSTKPQYIYTHNLADKHQTHIAVTTHVIEALRQTQYMPQALWGCEVWRGLDWLNDQEKKLLPIEDPKLIKKLVDCHKSQTLGGKSYSEATVGRMQANATFFESHQVDTHKHQVFAMDLLPLVKSPSLSFLDYIDQSLAAFKEQVACSLQPFSGEKPWK